jgi:hypothetical protein
VDLRLTIAAAALAAALAALFGWLGARKPDPGSGPRLIPWRLLMLLAAALAVMLLVHLVNMLGVTTGH